MAARFTTDDVLTRCIGQIRRALGDDPKNPCYLETLPRRGYRLLPSVTPSADPESLPIPGTAEPDKLIVLPFQYLASAADDYIADGMTELLTARLSTLRELRVLSRTSAMHFKDKALPLSEVASRSGAHWVVEGSVLQSGDRVQIVVQLIDARTDAHVWADDYLRDLGDLLLLQNEIVTKIAGAIRLRLGATAAAAPAPVSLPAATMRSYLLGRQLISKRASDALREAIEQFESVCESAPDYAPGWASRAEARFMLCHYGAESPSAALPACRADLERALALDPDLAIGLTCRGALRFAIERDMRGAERDLLRALSLQPGYSIAMLTLGNVYAVTGRFEEASGWLEQALQVDPLDVGINMNVGDHRILQRRYDEAIVSLEDALALAPDHRPSRFRLCWAQALAGQSEAATAGLGGLGPADDGDWQWFEYAALVAGASGDAAAARGYRQVLARIHQAGFVSPWSMARAAAASGDREASLMWLRRAKEQRSTSFPFAAVTPAFDELHDDPGFTALVALPDDRQEIAWPAQGSLRALETKLAGQLARRSFRYGPAYRCRNGPRRDRNRPGSFRQPRSGPAGRAQQSGSAPSIRPSPSLSMPSLHFLRPLSEPVSPPESPPPVDPEVLPRFLTRNDALALSPSPSASVTVSVTV